MCDASPFQQSWADSYSPNTFPAPPTRSFSSISPKTSIYGGPGGRRGAVVSGSNSGPCPLELAAAASLESIRRGSISTVMGNMNIYTTHSTSIHTLPVPVINPPLYCDTTSSINSSMLSPPSSPRSAPLQPVDDLSARKFQRQIMSTMQALTSSDSVPQPAHTTEIDPKDRFTPPPSPGPAQHLEVPSTSTTTGASRKQQQQTTTTRKRSRNVAGSGAGNSKPRRVSLPAAGAGAGAHTSARGAVKKASSASCGLSSSLSSSTSTSTSLGGQTRRGSSNARVVAEMALEGGLFKSGWSWESAYGNASA